VYDSLSRLKQATNPESGTILYTYDDNSNLATKTDARGVVATYSYDPLNRVVQRTYTAPSPAPDDYQATPDVDYFYDNVTNAKGKLTKVSSTVSTTEYTAFDILGRVTASRQTTDGGDPIGYPMTYTYNLGGALVEQQYPSGRVVKNVLDANGDLSVVKSKKDANHQYWNYAQNFNYDAAGAVTSMELGNGRWESTVFNSRLQPTKIGLGTTVNATDLLQLDYTYNTPNVADNNGNVLSQTIMVPTVTVNGTTYNGFTAVQTYGYDSLNRISQASEKPQGWTDCTSDPTKCWTQAFKYDRYGNRNFDESLTTTLVKDCAGAVCAADKKKYDPAVDTSNNRLKTTDGYSFDDAGNTKNDAQNRAFVYDGENKQTEVRDTTVTPTQSDPDANLIGRYWYDGDGKRVKKYAPPTPTSPGETTVFVYDAAGKEIAEYSTNVEPASTAKVNYLTSDHLGSPRINTDQSGEVISRHDYHPFGEEISTAQRDNHPEYAGDRIRKQFTGYERDEETELDFAQARMHNFHLGKFTSVDPIMSSAQPGDPQTWNRYMYSLNNPLNFVDPDGESPRTDTDRDGNVYSVTNDGDFGVYRHDDMGPNGELDTNRCAGDCVKKMGETEYWDEFLDHDYKTGEVTGSIAKDAKILFGTSFDSDISRLNKEATSSTLGAVEVAYQSTNGQKYDIKTDVKVIAPNGPNTGRLLNGKYATARSAGNYLAGMNGATTPLITPRIVQIGPIPIPWGTRKDYLTKDYYMHIAGGLQKGGKTGAVAAAAGATYGPAPYYGEIPYAGRMIDSGFDAGLRKRK
jgi:RHS repeat-associated protein